MDATLQTLVIVALLLWAVWPLLKVIYDKRIRQHVTRLREYINTLRKEE